MCGSSKSKSANRQRGKSANRQIFNQQSISNLQSAISLYRGPFLEGFSCDSSAFEDWALARRERINRQLREALHQLAELFAEDGEYEQSLQTARRLLELEPWDEAAHRLVMQGLAQSGQRSAALAQYETCRRILKQELNAEPSAETRALYESIRSDQFRIATGLESPAVIIQPTDNQPGENTGFNQQSKISDLQSKHNLPLPLTSFVGREEELAEVRRLLGFPPPGIATPKSASPKQKVRLLTLSGAGGCGKTRLAIEAARSPGANGQLQGWRLVGGPDRLERPGPGAQHGGIRLGPARSRLAPQSKKH